jgi:hypothetical protein
MHIYKKINFPIFADFVVLTLFVMTVKTHEFLLVLTGAAAIYQPWECKVRKKQSYKCATLLNKES